MLTRSHGDLLNLAVTFLRKLSIIGENKEEMKRMNIVQKVSKFIPCSSQALIINTMRLLFNLSFDAVRSLDALPVFRSLTIACHRNYAIK